MSAAATYLPSGLKARAETDLQPLGKVIILTLSAVSASHMKIIGSRPTYPVTTNFLSLVIASDTISSECPN